MKRYSQHQIEALLDKFMNGQTTVEEEALLTDYFRSDDVPAEWEDYRLMFSYFDRGMEGEMLQKPQPSLTRQMGRRWWGITAAACMTAAVVGTVLLHRPTATNQTEVTTVATQSVDTILTSPAEEMETQQLASVTSTSPVHPVSPVRPAHSTRKLKAENAKLARENERLQRELEDLKRRAFIIDMEAMGYKAVQDEDGNIVFIDLEQELENEFNNQPTINIPAL